MATSLSFPPSDLHCHARILLSSSSSSFSSPHSRRGLCGQMHSLAVQLPGRRNMNIRSALVQMNEPHAKTKALLNIDREPHKHFDQVIITVRSGDGGHGAVLNLPRTTIRGPRKGVDKNLYHKQRKPRKQADGTVVLPMGGHGGDVLIYASENVDSLLDFHKTKRHCAKRGGNVDAMGFLSSFIEDGISAPALRIPVPVGTVVKRKRGGKLLADLVRPGDKILVARGGRGGISMLEIPKENKGHLRPSIKAPTMKDQDDKALVLGAPGEEVTLELTLRVVADVGLVGLPNAGKSSLLASVTKAKPEIADYPFTTLMPNLGHIPGDPNDEDGGFSTGPKIADLPGLIKGAHLGKGLGRMFLRHLRRTRIVVHVVDASSEDPIECYKTLCEELYLYNPDYLHRPHIVALNKLDIPEAKERFESLKGEIQMLAEISRRRDDGADESSDEKNMSVAFPDVAAVVGISALEGFGVEDLLRSIRAELEKPESRPTQGNNAKKLQPPQTNMYIPGQWEL